MWPKVCESKRECNVGGLKMWMCQCWCPANSRVMVEVCRHRPLSFCDVLRHTDGSWHNTDRLHPLAPTLTPPFPLQNGCSLAPARLYVLSIAWFDRHSINAKSIITPLPSWFSFPLFFYPLSSFTFLFFTTFFLSSSATQCSRTGASDAFWMRF